LKRFTKVHNASRRVRLGLADYSRFKTTRAAIRGRKNGYDKYLKSIHSQILTLNIRNRDFVKKYNKKHDRLHMTKQETKSRLLPAEIPMPLTYMEISKKEELPGFYDFLANNHHEEFVVKPDRGHIGKGILVIKKRVGKRYITPSGRALELSQLTTHIERIIKGRFTTGKSDRAIVEELIRPHKKLRNLYYTGLLDIRVICFQGFPVMAMARLPTKKSMGKANLHRGAIGAGLRLGTGEIFHAIYKRRDATRHPDTKYKFIGFRFPDWAELLNLAVRAQMISGLGFTGVDICIDEQKGPLIMEVNKYPGLEIQIANQAGLLTRLRCIEHYLKSSNESLATQDKIEKALFWDNNDWTK
jgi:alpha-L-glutamate ligase-like protein